MMIARPPGDSGARAAIPTAMRPSAKSAARRRTPSRPSNRPTATPLKVPPTWNRELTPAACLAEKPEASSSSGIQLVSMKMLSRLAPNISQSRGVITAIRPANRAAKPVGSSAGRGGSTKASSGPASSRGSIWRARAAMRSFEPPLWIRKAMDSGKPRAITAARASGAMPPIRNSWWNTGPGGSWATTRPGAMPPMVMPVAMKPAMPARIRRGDSSAAMATALGITPPMPTPVRNRRIIRVLRSCANRQERLSRP